MAFKMKRLRDVLGMVLLATGLTTGAALAAVGQKEAKVAQSVAILEQYGAMNHTIVVTASASESASASASTTVPYPCPCARPRPRPCPCPCPFACPRPRSCPGP